MNKNWQNVAIVSVLMLALVGPCFGSLPNFLAGRYDPDTAIFLQMLAFLLALGLALAVTLYLVRAQKIDLQRIGLFAPTPWYAILAAVLIGLYWAYSTTFSLRAMDPSADPFAMWLAFNPLRIFLVIAGPLGACAEDFITRGFIMQQLKEARSPAWLQLLFSALLFALYHSLWMLPIIGVYFLFSLAASLFYGLLLGGLYLLGKRSLTPVMLSHGLTVFLGEPLLTYALIKTFML